MKRREDLTSPRDTRRVTVAYDSEVFGRFAESIASFIGTARFLVWQSGFIIVWILWNTLAPRDLQWDPWDRGLVLLTLALSIQAAYAAPLILLAQFRQERRDRLTAETDRTVAERTQSDTEFLAREIASVRLSLSDMVTGEDFNERFERLTDVVEELGRKVANLPGQPDESATGTSTSDAH